MKRTPMLNSRSISNNIGGTIGGIPVIRNDIVGVNRATRIEYFRERYRAAKKTGKNIGKNIDPNPRR